MGDEEVRDQLMTLLVAGHETTATALAWAFERLLRTPRVLAELRRSIAGGDGSYLEAVVKETLRVRPVVPSVGRILHAEHRVGPWTLPPGVEAAPSIVLTHGNPELYPAPREFRPERFLEDGAPDTYSWIPFGGGTRRCIGAAFAELEIATVLRAVLERTALEAVGRRGEGARRTGVTLVPTRGARVLQRRAPVARLHADGRAYEGVRTLREDRAANG
jgi:cytochrome P450